MKFLYVFSILFYFSVSSADQYSCDVGYYEIAKMSRGLPKPSKTFNKKIDLKDFKTKCKKGRCRKSAEIVKTKTDEVTFMAHNSKPPVVAAMLMHFKYGEKAKDFVQQAYSGTDLGNRFYLGTRSGQFDISVECKFIPSK